MRLILGAMAVDQIVQDNPALASYPHGNQKSVLCGWMLLVNNGREILRQGL